MTLGKKILELRLKSKRTQQQVSQLTGLAVSYLSRLENDRMSPSIRTLTKISEALHVPLTSFLDDKPVLEAKDRCPVSLSGQCILDQLFFGQGRTWRVTRRNSWRFSEPAITYYTQEIRKP